MAQDLKVPYLDYSRIEVSDDFLKRSGFTLARSENEIVEKMRSENEIFNFFIEVAIDFISFGAAKEFLKKEAVEKIESGEAKWLGPKSLTEATQEFVDYMVFAWGKAIDERGLSASRSISKLGAWLWLFGRDDLYEIINNDNLYNPYGAPALIAVCNDLGIEVPNDLIEFSKVKC